jgi:hypothetical protein
MRTEVGVLMFDRFKYVTVNVGLMRDVSSPERSKLALAGKGRIEKPVTGRPMALARTVRVADVYSVGGGERRSKVSQRATRVSQPIRGIVVSTLNSGSCLCLSCSKRRKRKRIGCTCVTFEVHTLLHTVCIMMQEGSRSLQQYSEVGKNAEEYIQCTSNPYCIYLLTVGGVWHVVGPNCL